MGRNAKRRKAAKLDRRTPTTVHSSQFGSLAVASGASTRAGTAVPAAAFRRSCDECGSGDIAWMSPSELAGAVARSERGEIARAIEYLGESAEAWRCNNCGKWGLFGDTHFEGF